MLVNGFEMYYETQAEGEPLVLANQGTIPFDITPA
jgi:hypothetical protein